MSTTSFSNALLPLAGIDAGVEPEAKPGFFARLVAAMIASREAQARREIERVRRSYGIEIELDPPVPGKGRDLPFQG